jgi:hypothetical protein
MSYIGIPPFGQTIRTVTEVTATSGQTTFNITGGYIVGYVDVFLNGVLLQNVSDYTATNNVSVVLTVGATAGDIFTAVSYQLLNMGTDANITPKGLWENANTISADYSISVGNNAISGGPITINSGITVTVPTGSTWTVV